MLVVATSGGRSLEHFPDPIPANTRLVSFIAHHSLLPQVAAMVTNGGYNGVQIALAHGVPLVVAGKSQEKTEVGARVAWAGVGINLRTQYPTAEQIRTAVRAILSDPRYRQRALALRAEIAQTDAPREAARLLERLAVTRQPVYRGQ